MLWNHPLGLPITPYVLVFVLAWLILKLIDLLEGGPARNVFWILRVVTVIVAIVLCVL